MKSIKLVFALFLINLLPLFSYAGFEVLGSLMYKYSAQKGETYSTVLIVRNTGESDQEIRIYLRDYLFNGTGAVFYNEPVSHNRSNASWIQYSPKTVILKGKETQNVQFEVSVPKSDTLIGTYWSLLMLEGVSPPDPSKAEGLLIIHESIRYAIQIVTNIGKTGIGQIEFQRPVVAKENDKSFLNIILKNKGDRYISPYVSIELFDIETGINVKSTKLTYTKILYPETSSKWQFPLDGVKTGKTYKAIIVADGSGEDVFGMEYTIVL